MTLANLIDDLSFSGGAVVSSAACSAREIAQARVDRRFAVNDQGLGFVRRPKEWLLQVSEAGAPSLRDEVCRLQAEVRRLRGENALAYEALGKLQAASNLELAKKRRRLPVKIDLYIHQAVVKGLVDKINERLESQPNFEGFTFAYVGIFQLIQELRQMANRLQEGPLADLEKVILQELQGQLGKATLLPPTTPRKKRSKRQ